MKKFFVLFSLLSSFSYGAEIFREMHVMNIVMNKLAESKIYTYKNVDVYAKQVDSFMIKSIGGDGKLFYMKDSKGDIIIVRNGDYLISPLTLSEIYVLPEKEFDKIF